VLVVPVEVGEVAVAVLGCVTVFVVGAVVVTVWVVWVVEVVLVAVVAVLVVAAAWWHFCGTSWLMVLAALPRSVLSVPLMVDGRLNTAWLKLDAAFRAASQCPAATAEETWSSWPFRLPA
jgi:hypothetical protein